MQIRTQSDVWIFTGAIALISSVSSELGVAGMYLIAGEDGFHLRNAIIMAGLMPIVIAVPITFYVARMSLALSNTQRQLRLLAETDPLTGLPNRRSFFRVAECVLKNNDTASASLLVIDADHFKELNDSYGHAVGDKALVAIADILRSSFRRSDLICRVGGEEFAVMLPGVDRFKAALLATRVVKKVAASPLSEPGAIIEYSVSCGVADTSQGADMQALFKAADDAMYLAKRQGRNRVTLLRKAA